MQLLPLRALRSEAAAQAALAAAGETRPDRARRLLREALLHQEIARRTGEIEALARAASAARRAQEDARGERRLPEEARIRHADILVLSYALFSDVEAAERALEILGGAAPADPVLRARRDALAAAMRARRIFAEAGREAEAGALADLDAAAAELERLARLGRMDPAEAREARCEVAELRLSAGLRSKDRGALEAGLQALDHAERDLDPDYRPLTWARARTVRAETLCALGDLTGAPETVSRAAALIGPVLEEISVEDSPLDYARAAHALGRALQALGEAYGEDALFDAALGAMRPALQALDPVPLLPLRSLLAHDAAMLLTRRAERRGDIDALRRAERAFRESLRGQAGGRDPVAWAVTQVALARIYEAQSVIAADEERRRSARLALASALEVFGEKGLRSLSEAALAALERLKSPIG